MSLITTGSSGLHPIHISVCELRYDGANRTLEATHKIFLDDLEAALLPTAKRPLGLGSPRQDPVAGKLIGAYVQARFGVKADGMPIQLQYLGFEADQEAAWIYLEAVDVPLFRALEVRDAVLLEHHSDQANLVNITRTGQLRSLSLRQGHDHDTARWE